MERTIANRLADWTGALALSGAGAFAGWSITPIAWFAEAPLAVAVAAALSLGTVGLAVMRRSGAETRRNFDFVPVAFEMAAPADELLLDDPLDSSAEFEVLAPADELLLDDPLDSSAEFEVLAPTDELLLDDPLDTPAPDSRVLRLFAPQTLPIPGEMVERIECWLEDSRQRRGIVPGAPATPSGHGPDSSPASAALHAALADIRRSLG